MPPGICLLFTTFGFLPVLTKPRVKKKKKKKFSPQCILSVSVCIQLSLFLLPVPFS